MELYWKAKINQHLEIVWNWINSNLCKFQSKRKIFIRSHKNWNYSYLLSLNWWMAKSSSCCRGLKVKTIYSYANFFSRFKTFGSYGLRFWSDFIHFGWKKLVVCGKGQGSLRSYKIYIIWIIYWSKRWSKIKTFFNLLRYETRRILGCSFEEGR